MDCSWFEANFVSKICIVCSEYFDQLTKGNIGYAIKNTSASESFFQSVTMMNMNELSTNIGKQNIWLQTTNSTNYIRLWNYIWREQKHHYFKSIYVLFIRDISTVQ